MEYGTLGMYDLQQQQLIVDPSYNMDTGNSLKECLYGQ